MESTSTGKRKKTDKDDSGLVKKDKGPKKKKSDKISETENDGVEDSVNHDVTVTKPIRETRKNKSITNNIVSSDKPKKIVFIDDEPHEVSESNTSKTVKANKRKNKIPYDDDEENVRDEDIDRFCDEIDDEDNEQYEDWIKQIEASLHPNKKKS